jgi:Zn-dependent peptidase ImmA (M78 family)
MTINVKYLSEQQIERDALGLLEAYFHELGQPIQIPIPADEILETHLGLTLDFDDLQTLLGVPDVLGALWADKREVFIDQSLEPDENPEMEGRYYFSVGHEIGHWRLHRQYLRNADGQAAMFTDREPEPTVICRTSQKKAPVEWQADYFSSCFLMPRQCVLDAWSKRFGSLKPIVYADIAEQNWTQRPKYRGLRPIQEIMWKTFEQKSEPHAFAFEKVAREFAPKFRVSIQAMRIRLENLGLLRIDHPVDQDLFSGF